MIHRAMATIAAALLLGAAPATAGKAPMAAKPIGDPASWISSDDYPASALQALQQGVVRIMLSVAADGQFTCSVTASSNVAALDQATCALLMARAHFEPGRDGHGRPIPTRFVRTIRWLLPDQSGPGPSVFHMMTCPGDSRAEIQIETAYNCIR